MNNRLGPLDIKQAIWDKRFRDLFPEFEDEFRVYLQNPGCACGAKLLRKLMRHRDRLKTYFPTKEVVPDEPASSTDYQVINCGVDDLEAKVKQFPAGKRLVAFSRFRDQVTAVLADVELLLQLPKVDGADGVRDASLNWRVINTTVGDLQRELNRLEGRKAIQISRFKDQVTAVVNDLNAVF